LRRYVLYLKINNKKLPLITTSIGDKNE